MDTVDGRNFIERQWYLITLNDWGLEEKLLCLFQLQPSDADFDTTFAAILFLWPFISLFFVDGLLFDLNILNVLVMRAASAYVMPRFRISPFYALLYPVSIVLILYTICNSAFCDLSAEWCDMAGTHYPLADYGG